MNYYKEAMKERRTADEMADEAASHHFSNNTSEAEIYEKKADTHWERHVELLKKVYPAPKPHHPIQVTLKDEGWYDDNGQMIQIIKMY